MFPLLLVLGAETFQLEEYVFADPLAAVHVELLPDVYEKEALTVTDHIAVPAEFLYVTVLLPLRVDALVRVGSIMMVVSI